RDVVQESYLRAWKGIKRFRGDAQFSTWMYRITANAAATLVQKRRRRRAESLDMVEEPIDMSIEGHPEAAAESAIGLEDLARAVAALPVDLAMQTHIESCLRCQAELARYRRMLRALQQLRTRFLEPSPSLLAQTLAALEEAGERHAVRSLLSGRRLAYAGAIGGA